MPAASRLRQLFLKYLSRPRLDRPLYKAAHRHQPRRIVEMGIGGGLRSVRLIEMAQAAAKGGRISYTGIDPFELRSDGDGPSLSLKEAYRTFKATGASVRLLPGDPYAALARGANLLLGTDLLIISADQQGESLERAWFYVPRMLHEGSQVYMEVPSATPDAPSTFRQLSLPAVEALAHPRDRRKAA